MGLEKEHIVLGNGSDDLITMLARAFLREGDEAVAPAPSFSMYGIAIQSAGARPVFAPLKSFSIDPDAVISAVSPKTRMVFLCNPNNPTGTILTRGRLEYLLERLPAHVVVVFDEAYMEFVRDPDCALGKDHIKSGRPVAALRTFSKIYGLAGLRVGYGMMPAGMADILNRIRGPFNTSSPAQAGACAALDDEDFLERSRKLAWEGLDFLSASLDQMGIHHVPSQANFLLMDVGDADAVFEKLLLKGIIARSMSGAGLPRHIRISAGLPHENRAFVGALKDILSAGAK
jgi:histidinol-phosphate aminotransferase